MRLNLQADSGGVTFLWYTTKLNTEEAIWGDLPNTSARARSSFHVGRLGFLQATLLFFWHVMIRICSLLCFALRGGFPLQLMDNSYRFRTNGVS